jgi:hypothetical protein
MRHHVTMPLDNVVSKMVGDFMRKTFKVKARICGGLDEPRSRAANNDLCKISW